MKKLCLPLIMLFFFIAALPAAAHDKSVTLNVKTLIYHDSGCKWAKNAPKIASKPPASRLKRPAPGPAKSAAAESPKMSKSII